MYWIYLESMHWLQVSKVQLNFFLLLQQQLSNQNQVLHTHEYPLWLTIEVLRSTVQCQNQLSKC